jgi:hypothetical protein
MRPAERLSISMKANKNSKRPGLKARVRSYRHIQRTIRGLHESAARRLADLRGERQVGHSFWLGPGVKVRWMLVPEVLVPRHVVKPHVRVVVRTVARDRDLERVNRALGD